MAGVKNFLLGHGELLTTPLDPPASNQNEKWTPYTFDQAKRRLSPKVASLSRAFGQAPRESFPEDEAVALFTLHPTFLAKSHFPAGLLKELQLELIGSRPRTLRPEAVKPTEQSAGSMVTSELYVAGPREAFRKWAAEFPSWHQVQKKDQIMRLEDVRVQPVAEKVKPFPKDVAKEVLLEVVLHASADNGEYILDGFSRYMRHLGLDADLKKRIQVGGLTFLALRAPYARVNDIAAFTYLRAIRPMPRMRQLWPNRESVRPAQVQVQSGMDFPTEAPVDPQLRVAIFDGGCPDLPFLRPWVKIRPVHKVGRPTPEQLAHGLQVTSAALFGALEPNKAIPRPFAAVEHFQVVDLDTDPNGNAHDALERVKQVLHTREHEFINISIGPEIPIDDNDVDAWTSVIDEHLSSGRVFATIAAGNGGEADQKSGNARVQIPADSVNALTVGACDAPFFWMRARYSSFGPGRSPGKVKPDGLVFGGTPKAPFYGVSKSPGLLNGAWGTSFASPAGLRIGLGMRATIGNILQPMAIKALMIHTADRGEHDWTEVGWGRFESELDNLLTCKDHEARILYQGEMEPGRYLRMPIPLPAQGLQGKVQISATFCFASQTDPQDPLAYTRAGLDIVFRPHRGKRSKDNPDSPQPATQPFFSTEKLYKTEQELRDSHKWETTRHAVKRYEKADLLEPCFDVHYNARAAGRFTRAAGKIPYALVVTIHCPSARDLYNQIRQRYRALKPLVPVTVQVPGTVVMPSAPSSSMGEPPPSTPKAPNSKPTRTKRPRKMN